MKLSPASASSFVAIALMTSLSCYAQPTLTFDALASLPSVDGSDFLAAANGGSRTVSGVTFNASVNSDWEVYGNKFRAFGSENFANSHSGSYVLAGNAFSGSDILGNQYNGLTISTSLLLTSLFVGFDDDGGGSNDANGLKITAIGIDGDLASSTFALTSKNLIEISTASAFRGLNGITGYRFETTAADSLNEAFGRAYLIADDIQFESGVVATIPEPPTVMVLIAGLLSLAWSRKVRRQS